MLSEDTLKLIQMRRNPVNSLQDLNKKLIGTREGFIFYTTNFRKDFDTKMAMLGRLEQENKQLKQELTKYKEVIDKAINNSQYWIDYYTRLNSDERIALRLQENIDILKEVE